MIHANLDIFTRLSWLIKDLRQLHIYVEGGLRGHIMGDNFTLST